jgi:hypothetical protein
MQTCRDCALPWRGAPCGNCGSLEPATSRPSAPSAAAEPQPKAAAKATKPARVSTTVKRTSTTVDPAGGIDVKIV